MGVENWERFNQRLERFDDAERQDVEWAYQVAKAAHRHQRRQGNDQRYFEHPRAVALILLDECKIDDPVLVVSALLHDVPEDTAMFGSNRLYPYSVWQKLVLERVCRMFGPKVAQTVIDVTKPQIDHIEISSHDQAKTVYLSQLASSSSRTKVLKMADRLHNLRTLSPLPWDKQARKIMETTEQYLSIFESTFKEYPFTGPYLFDQIQLNLINWCQRAASLVSQVRILQYGQI